MYREPLKRYLRASALLNLALEQLSPTRCCGCERAGTLVCADCLQRLQLIDPAQACTRCAAPFGRMLCTECEREALHANGELPQLAYDRCLAMAAYTDPLPRIIRAYKDAGEERLGPQLAELLFDTARHAEEAAPERYGGILSQQDCVVFVPVTARAYSRRGFDHMELVAQRFCELSGLALNDALAKRGKADQRQLNRQERQSAQQGVYELVASVKGQRVLLLDDVITTGATMRAAAQALKAAGAARIDALALARVW